MGTFEEINRRIQKDIEDNKILEPVATKGPGDSNPDGSPVMRVVGVRGKVVSKPGTEYVTIDASTFQLMECTSNAPGREKPRYCIVEKGKYPQYGNHFMTASGERAHVITREVYNILLAVLNNAGTKLTQLTKDVERANEQRDLYKLTVDALRKNGVID